MHDPVALEPTRGAAQRRLPIRQHGWLPWVVLLLGYGCDRSSPTEPLPEMPTVSVLVSQDAVAQQYQVRLREIIEETARLAGTQIPLQLVTANVYANESLAIPGYGIGGYALGPNEIDIVLDPTRSDLALVIEQNLPLVVAHELHHTSRLALVGHSMHLLDSLVLEGLADAFAVDLLGNAEPPWVSALSPTALEEARSLAALELRDPSYDFRRWFLGTGDLSHWTGYSLGYLIVRETIGRRGRSAAALVGEPSDSFWE